MLWVLKYRILEAVYINNESQHITAQTDIYTHFSSGLSRSLKQDHPPAPPAKSGATGRVLLQQHGIFMVELTTEIEHLE
jgi:hypothetical protein